MILNVISTLLQSPPFVVPLGTSMNANRCHPVAFLTCSQSAVPYHLIRITACVLHKLGCSVQ